MDDEPLAAALLEKHIAQFSQLQLVGSSWNAIEAFEILKKERIDLIFLDIQMPGLNGIEFVKSLQYPPRIIFTTAYRDYAVESYELNVVDYLLKPITIDRFLKAINKYLNSLEKNTITTKVIEDTNENTYIYVNTNRKHIKVVFDDVFFVESLKDYVRIHTANAKITTKDKISDFEHKLPANFVRVHRSYIVNIQKITAFTTHDIEIGDTEVPIGISYKKKVMEILEK